MKNGVFRIAVLQKRASCDCSQNTRDGLAAMEAAHRLGADLLLFPECFLTGYYFPLTAGRILEDDSPFLEAFRRKARELSMGTVITAFTKGNKAPRNSAYILGRKGELLLKYSKVHTCVFGDEKCLEPGEGFGVCDFDGIRLGVMICYDREYPESARILMLQGAEIILVPNDCQSMEPRVNVLAARAYENMVGVVMANPPGEGAGRFCAFRPIPWDEDGRVMEMGLFTADQTSERLFLAEYDLKELRAYRRREMMGNTFRRTDTYGKLLDPQVEEPFLRSV